VLEGLWEEEEEKEKRREERKRRRKVDGRSQSLIFDS
jgi:hypothetical protein